MKSDFLLAITQLSAEKNLPKDVVLTVAKEMGPDGANYRVIEYGGETVEGFSPTSAASSSTL